MVQQVQSVRTVIRGDADPFVRATRRASRALRNHRSAVRNTTRDYNQAEAATGRLARGFGSLTSRLAAFASVSAGFSLVASLTQAGLEIERLEQRFRFALEGIEEGAEGLQFVREEADRLGISFVSASQGYSGLAAAARGTSIEAAEVRDIFLGISEAAAVLRLDTDQTRRAFRALEQIISKGKVSAEELRGQLGENLPGAVQIMGRALGVGTIELDKFLEQGQLSADALVPFARQLREEFGAGVPDAMDSAAASFNRLSNSIRQMQQAIAQSGLLEFLAETVDGARELGELVGAFERQGLLPIEEINRRLFLAQNTVNELHGDIGTLRTALEGGNTFASTGFPRFYVENVVERYDEALQRLRELNAERREVLGLTFSDDARAGRGAARAQEADDPLDRALFAGNPNRDFVDNTRQQALALGELQAAAEATQQSLIELAAASDPGADAEIAITRQAVAYGEMEAAANAAADAAARLAAATADPSGDAEIAIRNQALAYAEFGEAADAAGLAAARAAAAAADPGADATIAIRNQALAYADIEAAANAAAEAAERAANEAADPGADAAIALRDLAFAYAEIEEAAIAATRAAEQFAQAADPAADAEIALRNQALAYADIEAAAAAAADAITLAAAAGADPGADQVLAIREQALAYADFEAAADAAAIAAERAGAAGADPAGPPAGDTPHITLAEQRAFDALFEHLQRRGEELDRQREQAQQRLLANLRAEQAVRSTILNINLQEEQALANRTREIRAQVQAFSQGGGGGSGADQLANEFEQRLRGRLTQEQTRAQLELNLAIERQAAVDNETTRDAVRNARLRLAALEGELGQVERTTEGYRAQFEELARGIEELEEMRRLKSIADEIGGAIGQLAGSAVRNFDDIGDAARRAGLAIADLILQQTVVNPIGGLISGGIGDIVGSVFGNAIGGSAAASFTAPPPGIGPQITARPVQQNTFNISGSDEATVRRAIAESAPQLADISVGRATQQLNQRSAFQQAVRRN